MNNPIHLIIVVGLALGGILGMAGTLVPDQSLRALCWGIDGTGLVVATALLGLRFFRSGSDCVAGGFLVFAIGEGIMLSGTALSLEASAPSFAAGASLWSAALFLTSVPNEFAGWVRSIGIVGGALFAITAIRIFLGGGLTPLSSPLPFFAYPFLVLCFVGWILRVVQIDRE